MRRAQRQKAVCKAHDASSVSFRTLSRFGRPTIVREVAVIKELERAGVIVPKIVFGEAVKIEGEWRALLVTEDMAGFISIADWYAQHAVSPYSDEVRQAMLKAVALAFKKMHSINRQHGCCYVRHIYVKTEGKAEAGFLTWRKVVAACVAIKRLIMTSASWKNIWSQSPKRTGSR